MLKIAFGAALMIVASVVAVRFAGNLPARPASPMAQAASAQVAAPPAAPKGQLHGSYGRATVVLAADPRGHFSAEPSINGVKIRTLVDTGASVVAMSAEDAQRAGVFPAGADFQIPVSTANGVVKAAAVRLREVRIDNIVLRDVEAMVLPQGRLGGTLLGMSFLRRLTGMEVSDGRLILTQ
ncbi:retropepsin-like aspartic protease family protein [Alsobacter sp. SYSU BS001988]|jgi:aspartyl protease family protein